MKRRWDIRGQNTADALPVTYGPRKLTGMAALGEGITRSLPHARRVARGKFLLSFLDKVRLTFIYGHEIWRCDGCSHAPYRMASRGVGSESIWPRGVSRAS